MIWKYIRLFSLFFLEVLAMPCEPVGHHKFATRSVKSCNELWRTFIWSSVVMCWTEEGYQLLWTNLFMVRREMDNAASSYEQHEYVSSIVFEM